MVLLILSRHPVSLNSCSDAMDDIPNYHTDKNKFEAYRRQNKQDASLIRTRAKHRTAYPLQQRNWSWKLPDQSSHNTLTKWRKDDYAQKKRQEDEEACRSSS